MNSSKKQQRDRLFQIEHLMPQLRERSVKAGTLTLVSQLVRFAMTLGSTMILARLLTPRDYGLVGMVTAVTGLAALLKDLGLSTVTMQRENITRQQVSTLFWVNTGVSALLMLIVAGLAPVIARFYNEPRLVMIAVSFSLVYLIVGLCVQHKALFQRQLRFTGLAVVEIGAAALGIVAALFIAWLGGGYWALVALHLVSSLVSTAGVWMLCRWLPGRPVWNAEIRAMLLFGGNLTGVQILQYLMNYLGDVLIGRVYGAEILGYYSKAYFLLLLHMQRLFAPISSVAIPTLSRLVGEPARYRQAFGAILEKVQMITMPGVVTMMITADWVVAVVLGPQWGPVTRLFQVFGFYGLLLPLAGASSWIFLTHDRTRELFRLTMVLTLGTVITILIGLPWGPMGVAVALTIFGVLFRAPLTIWCACRKGPVRWTDFCRAAAPFFCASLVLALALLAYRAWLPVQRPLVGLLIAVAIAGVVYPGTLLLMPRGRQALRDLKSFVGLFRTAK